MSNELKPKVKLTKTLPSENGFYYWAPDASVLPVIGEIDSQGDFYEEGQFVVAREMGGYWAKVEQDQFEFEG